MKAAQVEEANEFCYSVTMTTYEDFGLRIDCLFDSLTGMYYLRVKDIDYGYLSFSNTNREQLVWILHTYITSGQKDGKYIV